MENVVREIKTAESCQPDSVGRGGRPRVAAFLDQLRERKVCRAAVAYMLATWFVIQLGEIIFPALQLPDWTLTLVVVLAAIEFPVAMLLAWLFDWTPDGVVIDVQERSSRTPPGFTDSALNVALLLAAALLSAQLAWSQGAGVNSTKSHDATVPAPETIVVLPFSKAIGAESGVAYGLEGEIRHQLLQVTNGPRISTLAGNVEGLGQNDASAAEATLALEGTVYDNGDQIRLLVQVIDLKTSRYVRSVSLTADSTTSQDARVGLARRAVKAAFDTQSVDSDIRSVDDAVAPGPNHKKGEQTTANL